MPEEEKEKPGFLDNFKLSDTLENSKVNQLWESYDRKDLVGVFEDVGRTLENLDIKDEKIRK